MTTHAVTLFHDHSPSRRYVEIVRGAPDRDMAVMQLLENNLSQITIVGCEVVSDWDAKILADLEREIEVIQHAINGAKNLSAIKPMRGDAPARGLSYWLAEIDRKAAEIEAIVNQQKIEG